MVWRLMATTTLASISLHLSEATATIRPEPGLSAGLEGLESECEKKAIRRFAKISGWLA